MATEKLGQSFSTLSISQSPDEEISPSTSEQKQPPVKKSTLGQLGGLEKQKPNYVRLEKQEATTALGQALTESPDVPDVAGVINSIKANIHTKIKRAESRLEKFQADSKGKEGVIKNTKKEINDYQETLNLANRSNEIVGDPKSPDGNKLANLKKIHANSSSNSAFISGTPGITKGQRYFAKQNLQKGTSGVLFTVHATQRAIENDLNSTESELLLPDRERFEELNHAYYIPPLSGDLKKGTRRSASSVSSVSSISSSGTLPGEGQATLIEYNDGISEITSGTEAKERFRALNKKPVLTEEPTSAGEASSMPVADTPE